MPGVQEMEAASLIVVGTGICAARHMSVEAIATIQSAEIVYGVAANPEAEKLIRDLNPRFESLSVCYAEGKARKTSYAEMIEKILSSVFAGISTCVVLYGHPGVFAYPAHEAIRRARLKGYRAVMQPGISAEDCLFADLGIDPGNSGCQSYEATDFLINRRITDPASHLLLWQIGVIGDTTHSSKKHDLRAFPQLMERLMKLYHDAHIVTVYEAGTRINDGPRITQLALSDLTAEKVTAASTLHIPPESCLSPGQGLEQRYSFSTSQGIVHK